MIKLRPGQLCTIDHVVYRAVRRTAKCYGCDLGGFFRCPNVVDSRSSDGLPKVNCWENNFVLKKVPIYS